MTKQLFVIAPFSNSSWAVKRASGEIPPWGLNDLYSEIIPIRLVIHMLDGVTPLDCIRLDNFIVFPTFMLDLSNISTTTILLGTFP